MMDLEPYPGPNEDDGVRTIFVSDNEIALMLYTTRPGRVTVNPRVGQILYWQSSQNGDISLGVILSIFPRNDGYVIRYRSDSGA